MSTSQASVPPASPSGGGTGPAALLAALETSRTAIWCLAGPVDPPVWANARARALGAAPGTLPVLDDRPLADVVEEVLRTGRIETLSGRLGWAGGGCATAVARPVDVEGAPGVLLVLDAEDAEPEPTLPPGVAAAVVAQAQHSLLPPDLPLLPDVELSGSYHRASSVHVAGGDWYDAVPLGRGRLALVIGDAVGHGMPAAGAMSRLRGAMRASALRDPSPAAVLAALDAFAAHMDDVEGASVFYGLLDVGSGRFRYAGAGHPAPLVVRADGATTFLPLHPRPPLGSVPGTATVVAEQVLERGSTVILYSDGLFPQDARSAATQAADAGPRRLVEVARAAVSVPGALDPEGTAGLAAAIVDGVAFPHGRPDDVAVLVAHRRAVAPAPLHLELAAVPSSLPAVRRRLVAWLDGLGMGEQDRVAVLVAVGEACANAAEHAYRDSEPGPMYVDSRVDVDGVLTVTVRDEGTWRPPERDPGDRGRGLLIMRQLVDGVRLAEERGTTVRLSLRLRRGPEDEPERAAGEGGATVTIDRRGERPAVRVSGAVDHLSAEQLRIRLLEASHGGTGPVDLDLTGVRLFSSAAVRVVLAVARIARDEGWRLVVHAPAGGITRHILRISGLGGLVELR